MPVAKVKKIASVVEADLAKVADKTLTGVGSIVGATEKRIESAVAPIRNSIFNRFPVLIGLTVTFGVTATLVGMEQLLLSYNILQAHPGLIFSIGIGTLVLTGTLYKKLS